jgi:tetratricopeptide (TPR) repeat protein
MDELISRVTRYLKAGDVGAARAFVEAQKVTSPAGYEIGSAVLAAAEKDATGCLAHADLALGQLGASNPWPLHLKAIGLALNGELEEAEALTRRATDLGDPAPVWETLASLLSALGRDAEAISILQRALQRWPDNPSLHIALGLCRHHEGQLREAVDSIGRAFALDPTNPKPLEVLLEMHAEIGRWFGAMTALNFARRGQPSEGDTALDLAKLMAAMRVTMQYPKVNFSEDRAEIAAALLQSSVSQRPALQLGVARGLIDCLCFSEARQILERLESGALDSTDAAASRYLAGVLAQLLD